MSQPESSPTATENAGPALSEDVKLIRWIESHPHYAALIDEAAGTAAVPTPPRYPRLRRVLAHLQGLVFSDPREYHGTAFVTQTLRQDAEVTSRVVTTSNIIDAFGNFPIFLFAAGGTMNLLGWGLSLFSTLALLKIGNDMSTTVARGKEGSKAWALWAALLGFIPLSIVKSFATGVGVELINNRSGLSQMLAAELADQRLVETQQALEDSRQITTPSYQSAQQRCVDGKADLQRLAKDSPLWASTYVNLYGQWNERRDDWQTVPFEKLPVCRQVTRLEEAANRAYEQTQAQYQELQTARQALGNDVTFLQTHYAGVYSQHFTPEGEIKSGVEAVSYALSSYLDKLQSGNWNQLGLSLFFLLISVLTSTVACYLVIAYSRRQDVQMSWSESLRQERDRWLNEQFNLLLHRHAQERQAFFHTQAREADRN